MIVSYGERANDEREGREALIGQRKCSTGWLYNEIVEVLKKFKHKMIE